MLVGVAIVSFVLAIGWWWMTESATSTEFIGLKPGAVQSAAPVDPAPPIQAGPSDADAVVNAQSQLNVPFELQDLSAAQIGESFSITVPQENRDLNLTVSETRRTPAGNQVIIAENLIEGRYHRLILTIGQHESFGNIQTDRDRYQFAIADGFGDIHAVSAMNRRLNHAKDDFVIRMPEQELPPVKISPEKIKASP